MRRRPTRTISKRSGLTGRKAPLRLKEIWVIRIRLQLANKITELALLNLAIDSKLHGCDLIALHDLGLLSACRLLGEINRIGPAAKKATPIQWWTHNVRAVRLPPGNTKLASTVRYLGIDVDDALEIAEQTEVWIFRGADAAIAGGRRPVFSGRSILESRHSRAVVLRTRYDSKRAMANRKAAASEAFLLAYRS